jgi:hypothetical protein
LAIDVTFVGCVVQDVDAHEAGQEVVKLLVIGCRHRNNILSLSPSHHPMRMEDIAAYPVLGDDAPPII